ncbi:hypothetical protein ACLOJK_000235 [Asimina triloba]
MSRRSLHPIPQTRAAFSRAFSIDRRPQKKKKKKKKKKEKWKRWKRWMTISSIDRALKERKGERMASCTVRSTSCRREPRVENQQQQQLKKIGCMSGIFHLLHNHHHHSRKRITSAGKKNRRGDSEKKPKPQTEIPLKPPPDPSTNTARVDWRRLSFDVPRSPTLPAEIRRSNSVNSPTAFRRQPALVARLMGLEELPAEEPEQSNAEKRRKILGALEKCDQDLKALKKIIEAVQAAEGCRRAPPPPPCPIRGSPEKQENGGRNLKGGDDSMTTVREKRGSDLNGEQPSPVSVLDGIPSPFRKTRERSEQGGQFKKLKDHDHELNGSFFSKILFDQLPRLTSGPHKRAEGGPFKCMSSTVKMIRHHRGPAMFRGSKAMIEAVNEVWTDGIWRERWEFGRLGIVLEGYILGELVEEIVKEMGFHAKRSLPFENCRKRLYFN